VLSRLGGETCEGFLSHGGTPIAGWFIRENPNLKWMIWGYPHGYGNPHVGRMMEVLTNRSIMGYQMYQYNPSIYHEMTYPPIEIPVLDLFILGGTYVGYEY